MRSFLKVFAVFGFLMGLLGFGLTFLGSSTGNGTPHEAKSEAGGAPKQEEVGANSSDAVTEIRKSYEAYKTDFNRKFSTFEKPLANLRWYPVELPNGSDHQEMSDLVTPYGPCATVFGNTAYGYEVDAIDPYQPTGPPRLLGSRPSRASAVQTAEDYCQQWYVTESTNPASPSRTRPLWFTPDPEVAPLPSSTGERQENSTYPSEQAAPIERSEPSQAPATIERRPPS